MAQSTAPPRAVTLRNFARRPRVPNVPPPQRLHGIDAGWMAAFAVISILLSFLTGGARVFTEPQTYLAAVTVICLYLLGFRVRDRATAIIAAALLATSPVFSATQIESVRDSLFVLFTISALAAYANAPYTAAAELLAVVIAAVATILRPEGFLLGAVLLGFAITDKRPGGIVGLVIYLVIAFAGIAGIAVYLHQPFPRVGFSPNIAPFLSLVDTKTVILSCFIIALLGDLADPTRRARWKTLIVWSVLFLCVESLFRFAGFSFETGPFRPILFLLAAGGIARLLPVIAGDFPNPVLRYGIAVLFVGVLVIARVSAEWPVARTILTKSMMRRPVVTKSTPRVVPPAHRPVVAHVPVRPNVPAKPVQVAKLPPPAKTGIPAKLPTSGKVVVPPGTVHHYVYVPAGALKPATSKGAPAPHPAVAVGKPAPNPQPQPIGELPASLVAAATAAGVQTYYVHNGQKIPRSPWAIKWDIDHKPKPVVAVHPAPKPAVKIAAKPMPKPAKPAAHVAPKPIAKAVAKPKPAVKATAKPAVKKAPANSLEAQAAAAGVPTYHIVGGRRVARTVWAIKWDIAHHLGHPAPKHAAAPAHRPVEKRAVAAPHRPAPRHAVAAAHRPAPVKRVARPVKARRPAVRRPIGRRVVRRNPLRKRHRSIWAIRWHQAHPNAR